MYSSTMISYGESNLFCFQNRHVLDTLALLRPVLSINSFADVSPSFRILIISSRLALAKISQTSVWSSYISSIHSPMIT